MGESIAAQATSGPGGGSAYRDGDIGRSELRVGKPYQSDFGDVQQLVGAFGDGSTLPADRGQDVLLAAGPGYSGLGVDPGSMESLRGPDGVYRLEISGTSDSPATYGAGGAGVSDGVIELPRVVITGRRMTDAAEAAYSAQLFQETNDARVATGTYDRFVEVGSAWSSGRYGDIWRHLAFDASNSAKTSAAARTYQPMSLVAQRFDRMLTSPIGATASLAVRALGGNQTWQDAALIVGSFGESVVGGALGLPRAVGPAQTQLGSPPRGPLPFSPLSQPGGLSATEGGQIRRTDGRLSEPTHPLAKHGPDVSDQYVMGRVVDELQAVGRAGLRTAFNERAQMEAAIAGTLTARRPDINAWLGSAPRAGVPRAFEWDPGMGNLGRGFEIASPGGPVVPINRPMPNVNVVLIPDGRGGYLIHTAHPKP